MIVVLFAGFAAAFSSLGCGGDTTVYETGTDCHVEPATLMMEGAWLEADTYMRTCQRQNEDLYHQCQYHSDDAGMNKEECMEGYYREQLMCTYFYAQRVNRMPLRECGVVVFRLLVDYEDVMNGTLPEETQVWEVNTDDDDGDGISTWHEKWIGYNPCTPYSFGRCVSDAELDYDADGVLNGEDDANNPDGDGSPICNWDDPGHWQTDCI